MAGVRLTASHHWPLPLETNIDKLWCARCICGWMHGFFIMNTAREMLDRHVADPLDPITIPRKEDDPVHEYTVESGRIVARIVSYSWPY